MEVRNPAKWKWHFSKAIHRCQCKSFCVSPWTNYMVWKDQRDSRWKWGVSAPGTQQRMSRAGGENSLTLCVFSWFVETFAETGLQELQMCEMTWGDTKMSKASNGLRMLYCPVPGQALQLMLHILPGHHLCLDVGQVFLMREGEESKNFRGRKWKILISTHSLLCVLRYQVVWEAQRDRCSLLLCICTTFSSENDYLLFGTFGNKTVQMRLLTLPGTNASSL